MGLNVNLCGIELDNPVIPASGTFGYGYEFAEIYDINCLGSLSFKGTTKESRFGNNRVCAVFSLDSTFSIEFSGIYSFF